MAFLKIKIKTTWQGKVGVRDKYINQAIQEDKGLMIVMNDEWMEIERKNLEDAMTSKSKQSFYDRYSGKYHYLYYFDWVPEKLVQLSLF